MSLLERRYYDEDFKVSSVKLAIESEDSVSQIARDLGLKSTTLHGWISKYKNDGKIMSKKESTEEENKRLKKELALVKQERDILKKATAYFAKEAK